LKLNGIIVLILSLASILTLWDRIHPKELQFRKKTLNYLNSYEDK